MDLNVQRIEGCLRSYYVTYCGSSILIRRAWKSCYIWLMMQDPKYYIAEYYEAACKNICIEAYEELKKELSNY